MKFKEAYQILEAYLIEGYKEAIRDFSKEAEEEEVRKVIDIYKDLVKRNQVKGQERNIDYWRKQGWEVFRDFVLDLEKRPSKTQIKRKKVVGKSITLMENDEWLIVIPLDKHASCFHGRHTDWCTAKPNQSYFEDYFYDKGVTLIYCLKKKTGEMWAIAAHKNNDKIEMFTQDDRSISEKQFKTQTGLDAREIVNLAFKNQKVDKEISSTREGYKSAMKELMSLISNGSKDYKKIEDLLRFTKSGPMAVKYVEMRAGV